MIINQLSFHAKNTPNKIALKDISDSLTYLELLNRFKNISAYLLEKCLIKDDYHVMIVCNKNINTLEWILGILDQRASFIPVDKKNPINRIKKNYSGRKAKNYIM